MFEFYVLENEKNKVHSLWSTETAANFSLLSNRKRKHVQAAYLQIFWITFRST